MNVVPELPHSQVPRHDIPAGGRSGFVIVDGRQVHYLEWGPTSAPAVVLLHGGGQTAYMWEELGATLADRYHVLAPDLPGHGDSDPPVDPEVRAAASRQVIADTLPPLIEEFAFAPVALVGASLGGLAAITLTAARPELVRAIALVDIGHRLEDEGINRIVEFLGAHESFASLEEARDVVAEYLPGRRNPRLESLRRNLRQRDDGRWVWKHQLGRLRDRATEERGNWRAVTEGLVEDMQSIRVPALVLRGKQSDVLSDEGAEEAAQLIPGAQLERVAGAGHHLAGDEPETANELIASFLDRVQ
ncbi:MAG: alpha/beta fold hydrolase [Acidimicrobiia bacterium]